MSPRIPTMATPQAERGRRIEAFLRPAEIQQTRETLFAVAHKIMYIADADLRHQTEQDWKQIQNIRRDVLHESAWNPRTSDAVDALQTIIQSGTHTMLGKVYAAFAAVDIVHQTGGLNPRTFSGVVRDAIATAPTETEGILITAALHSRYMAWIMTHADTPQEGVATVNQMEEILFGLIKSPLDARRKLAVQAAAEVFASEIREDAIGMRLPEAYLTSAYTDASPSRRAEGIMIPQGVMYLPPGHLVSWNKLIEATTYGIPGAGRPVRRIPQLLVGVEINVGQQTRERTHTKIGYVAMRALRKPRSGNIDWTTSLMHDMRRSFSDEKLFKYCSFDSLSLIAAVRIARQLDDENTPAGFYSSNILHKIDAVIARFLTEYPTAFGGNDSILSVALAESQQIDGDDNWDLLHAAKHIRSQIIGLLVADVNGGRVEWRRESELWQLYQQHVIAKELTQEDKLEMMAFLLQDTQHELWRRFESAMPEEVDKIVQWIYNRQPLTRALTARLVAHVPHYIVQRCETIRDTHLRLPRKGNAPDDAE